MPASDLKLIRWCAEFIPREQRKLIPHNTRGIYALLEQTGRNQFRVVYIGMAARPNASVRGRLRRHEKGRKKKRWTHFSVFAVWENVTQAEVAELEGLARHIYRKEKRANWLNRQRSFKKLSKVRVKNLARLSSGTS
jgi:hypothetical protein